MRGNRSIAPYGAGNIGAMKDSYASELRLRVRQTIRGSYVWELSTKDGHIVNTSRDFQTQAECVADARHHQIPILGVGPSAGAAELDA